MKVIAMIPARYSASRFPGKLMKDLGGQTVIARTYETVVATSLFDEVFVVTDSDAIAQEINKIKGKVIRSQKEHESGSDRIAEAAQTSDADIIINVQGDEPFIDKSSLEPLIAVFKNDTDHIIDLASLKVKLTDVGEISNPNNVKVITDCNDFALYFSRHPIPYQRTLETHVNYFKHVGIYAFRKQALLDFATMPITPLEASEKIECIRFLEYGKRIKMVEIFSKVIGIDTPEDLEKAKQIVK